LLRDVGRLNPQNVTELIHTLLTISETVEDPNANRVREGFEELSLEVGQLLRHAHPCVQAYSNLRKLLCRAARFIRFILMNALAKNTRWE
jgi:hypothetical protein